MCSFECDSALLQVCAATIKTNLYVGVTMLFVSRHHHAAFVHYSIPEEEWCDCAVMFLYVDRSNYQLYQHLFYLVCCTLDGSIANHAHLGVRLDQNSFTTRSALSHTMNDNVHQHQHDIYLQVEKLFAVTTRLSAYPLAAAFRARYSRCTLTCMATTKIA